VFAPVRVRRLIVCSCSPVDRVFVFVPVFVPVFVFVFVSLQICRSWLNSINDDLVMLSEAVVATGQRRSPTRCGGAVDRSIPTLVPPDLAAVRSLRMPGSPTGAASQWALSTLPRSHCPPGGWPARCASVLTQPLRRTTSVCHDGSPVNRLFVFAGRVRGQIVCSYS